MPAPYDDIVDALALTADGSEHVVTLDNTGATLQTGESTYLEGWPTVWVKIDLSAFADGTVFAVPMALAKTGGDAGFDPYLAVFKVNDASFDPSAPDFSKLSYHPDWVGDGTTTPSATVTLEAGTGSSAGNRSQTSIFYCAYTDWNYVGYGSSTLTYTIPVIVCIAAVDVIHPDSTTTSVVSGRVQEDWDPGADASVMPEQAPTPTFRLSGADILAGYFTTGLYELKVKGQYDGTPTATTNRGVRALITRNGVPQLGVTAFLATASQPTYDGYEYELNSAKYQSGTAPFVPVAEADVIDITIWCDAESGGTFMAAQIETLCFYKVTGTTPIAAQPFGSFDQTPLGMSWSDIGLTLGNYGAAHDFCVMPNGDVYAGFIDLEFLGGGTPPSDYEFQGEIWYYEAATDTWTTLLSGFNAAGFSRTPIAGLTVATDGTDVFIAYWEWDGTYWSGAESGLPGLKRYAWHVKKYDVSGDSWTELGTGQRKNGITNSRCNVGGDWPKIDLAFDGTTVYAAMSEVLDAAVPANDTRPYVWEWNGSTWTDTAFPDPPTFDYTTWEINALGMGYQERPVTLCMTPDGLAAFHAYEDATNRGAPKKYYGHYAEYASGSWGVNIRSDPSAVETGRMRNDVLFGYAQPTLLHDGTDVLLVSDFISTNNQEIWDVLRLLGDKSEFETTQEYAGATAIVWGQGHNDAVIGGDGRVHKAVKDQGAWFTFYVIAREDSGPGGWLSSGSGQPLGPAGLAQATVQSADFTRIRANANDLYVMILADVYDPANAVNQPGIWIVKGRVGEEPFVPHIYRIVHT